METSKSLGDCQLPCLPKMSKGLAEVPPESIARRLRLVLRRSLNVKQVRMLKTNTNRLIDWFFERFGSGSESSVSDTHREKPTLNAGDLVRVRSVEEIKATLNHWGILKGCMFMPNEMSMYCGTTQRVVKRMERFVDERDYRVKKCNGIILLEGLNCQGTTDYGRCDRNCFFFWREEWLEKIDENTGRPAPPNPDKDHKANALA